MSVSDPLCQFLGPENFEPETDILCQILEPETDIMGQFLEPETDCVDSVKGQATVFPWLSGGQLV